MRNGTVVVKHMLSILVYLTESRIMLWRLIDSGTIFNITDHADGWFTPENQLRYLYIDYSNLLELYGV